MTRRNPQHGGVPWYLMFAIVAALGIGFVVYRVMRERRIAEAAERARAPKQAPRPVEVAAVPEPTPVAEEAPVPEEPAPPPAACDEVSCVLDNYTGPCCARFKAKRAPTDSELPESLDRAMISQGIASVRELIMTCGDVTEARGRVKVKVRVGANGRVTVVTVESAPDEQLGACVAGFVKQAQFAQTQTGGSFSYPFIF